MEIIVVIAILGLLISFAVPSAIKIYNESKKKAFFTQAINIYDVSIAQYSFDKIDYNNNTNYCFSSSAYDNKLDSIEKEDYYYKITFNNDKVIEFMVSTDNYSINLTDVSGITKKDLKLNIIKESREESYIEVTCNP